MRSQWKEMRKLYRKSKSMNHEIFFKEMNQTNYMRGLD